MWSCAIAVRPSAPATSAAPTCSVRGVVEPETLPEALELIANWLTKQIESPYHDSQVFMEEAVGYPAWVDNHQAEQLRRCHIDSRVQRTHHWSPLKYATEFVTTERDRAQCIYDAPKDRHIFPWVEFHARFGLIDAIT